MVGVAPGRGRGEGGSCTRKCKLYNRSDMTCCVMAFAVKYDTCIEEYCNV